MFLTYIVGTAGSGKSLLTSNLVSWYANKGSSVISVNLDPGVLTLPYSPDVDIRNYINIEDIMDNYQLGPNGALIFASDLIATRINDLQNEIDELNAEYVIVDTPGQMELFAYRASGPFVIKNLRCDNKALLFLLDGSLMSSPVNFISIALLGISLQLRIQTPQIPVLTKSDLVGDKVKRILNWALNSNYLLSDLRNDVEGNQYLLSHRVLRELIKSGFGLELIPISSTKQEGMIDLSGTLVNIFKGGEEVED
jgi:GTPase SAR1 family protein